MPWRIEENHPECSGYAVVKEGGEFVACHSNEADALAQIAALYAAEEENEMEDDDEMDMSEYRVFVAHEFAEPQEWIPYLPLPGTFKHPQYGNVAFSKERNERFVDNFKKSVYQSRIPLDAEHQTKLSGAVGWITDMRVNDNGSADARVEWTDRGTALLTKNRFRYVSPEFYAKWQDPATEIIHEDIAIGGALTTRPFVKESHLRPLVASEMGYFLPQEEPTRAKAKPKKTGAKSMNEETTIVKEVESVDPVQFAELQSRLAEIEAAKSEAEAQATRLTEALDKSNERIAKMEEVAQNRRFTELVEGNVRWYGETDMHMKILRSFSETFGEDSEEFGEYVRMQKAVAEQIKESALFVEAGTTRAKENMSAADELDSKAKAIAQDKGITYPQAYAEAMTQNPSLYERYRKGE